MPNHFLNAAVPARSWLIAIGSMLALVAAAFIAAELTVDQAYFSLSPPASADAPQPAPDVRPEDAIKLYQTFYTAWATMLLLFPALAYFWFRHQSELAARRWLLFWTVSYGAFIVHLFWAMFIFFDGDFARMTSTTRVSAFWPDIIVAFWWGADILLAWSGKENSRWMSIQRVVVHLAVFILFVAGSALEGELLLSKMLGILLAATVFGTLARRYLFKPEVV